MAQLIDDHAATQAPRRALSRRACVAVIVVVLCVCALAGFAGCRDTSKLTEVIYDQSYEEIDYDNPVKLLVQDPQAEETSDQLPLVNSSYDTPPEEEVQDQPLEDDEDQNEEQPAPDQNITQATGQSYATNDTGTTRVEGGSSDEQGDANNGDNGDVQNETSDKGDSGNSGEATTGTDGARSGGETLYYDTAGEYENPPEGVDYVAAVGEAATIVSMLAGDAGALLYTDAEWVARPHLKEVLGGKFNQDVQAAWSKDGKAYSVADDWVDAMISDEKLECVFFTSGSSMLTEDQIQKFNDAGIIVSVIPDMSTASNITAAVKWIGAVLSKGQNHNEQALSLAESYVQFHDEVLADVSSLASTEVNDGGSRPVTSEDPKYTLYISDWYWGVDYVEPTAGMSLDMSHGIGVATLGSQWSPLAYYLSVAGAYNTASADPTSSGTSLVWQFNTNHLPAKETSFSASGLVSSYQRNSGDTAYGWTYLMSSDHRGVGTTYFPYVIVPSQTVKQSMEADRDSQATNSLYKLYDLQMVETGSVSYYWVGPMRSEAVGYVGYSVGGLTDSQSSSQSLAEIQARTSQDASYGVLVNPQGLFESWTDGSVESVLEAAWISYYYRNGDNPAQRIRDFYEKFYGYSLSNEELNTILNGPE